MSPLKLFRRAAALTLGIVLAPGAASAEEDRTITISSTFNMDWLVGTVGPDLAEVYANGHEHTWTLTLYGTSQSHKTFTNPFGVTGYDTEIHATSFDFEFFGPDAAMLNGIVSDNIAGGDVFIFLSNRYSSGIGDDFAVMFVEPTGPDFWFVSDCDVFGCGTLFPADADGYPVVGPDPFSIWNEYSALVDNRPGNGGYIESRASLVTFAVVPISSPLPGDFNGDNVVDAADYVLWRKTGGSQAGYNDWRAHFGALSPGAAAVARAESHPAVPEPATTVLLLFGISGLGMAGPTTIIKRRASTACDLNKTSAGGSACAT